MTDKTNSRGPYRPMFGGGLFRRRDGAGYIVVVVWLAFLVFPIVNAIEHKEPTPGRVAATAAATVFVVRISRLCSGGGAPSAALG